MQLMTAMNDYNEIEQGRLAKLEQLRSAGIEPYPPRVQRSHTTAQAIRALEAAEVEQAGTPGESLPEIAVTVVGRIRSMRVMGKLAFAHIEDGWGRIQLFLRANEVGAETLKQFEALYDLGDFVQAEGVMMRTKTGEASVQVRTLTMLSKSITPLPAAKERVTESGETVVYSAFDNPEARYRQRYVDLVVNPQVRDVFRARAKVVSAVRRFLDNHDFLEVETPILQPIYGGAAARPFETHHNQLHQNLFLRISFELYLKRLLVGGYERVYEIGRDFRNEGVSFKHNPEFTQIEFYAAYWDYNTVMDFTERMVAYVAEQVTGSTRVMYQGEAIEFAPPWRRVTLRDAIFEKSGIDINVHRTAEGLRVAMQAAGLEPKAESTWGKLVESLLNHFVEPDLIQPTFLMDYPRDISPLAKSKPGDPTTVERFEGYVGGMELCNAFTELNDPLDQEQRFLEMGRDYAGEEDQHPMDGDYLQAMRYGMPPNGGFGMGIDRLTMLLTDNATIREVLLFPHLRPRDRGSDVAGEGVDD